jgi:hypothetical protein
MLDLLVFWRDDHSRRLQALSPSAAATTSFDSEAEYGFFCSLLLSVGRVGAQLLGARGADLAPSAETAQATYQGPPLPRRW